MPKKGEKAKKSSAKKSQKRPEELRLTQLEQVELNLCERDEEYMRLKVQTVDAQITNLTLNYHQNLTKLKEERRTAVAKAEQATLIRNKKLSEIEHRLAKLQPGFNFRDYLEQDDGTLILAEDKIVSLDPTAEGSGT